MAAPRQSDGAPARSASPLRRWAPVAVLALILVLFFASGLNRHISFGALRDNRAAILAYVAAHGATAGLVFIALYVVAGAASIPGGTILTIMGGFLFGPWLGTLYVLIGATAGATVLFLAARSAIGDSLRRRLDRLGGGRGERLAHDLERNALSYLLVLRLVPLFPFWFVNLVAAAAGIPLGIYVIGTFLGIIPASFVYVSIGNGLGAVFDRGETPDLAVIATPEVLVPLIGLAVLALIPVVYRRFRRPPAPDATS